MRLEGKVAIITGAASGMGQAGARIFAREGAKVIVADINAKAGQETVSEIKKAGGEATFVQVDVSKLADLRKMIKTAVDTYGKLNILWNHAGIPGKGSLDTVEEKDWYEAMDVNIKSGFFATQFAVPEMKKVGGGAILFTSSISGVQGSNISPLYSAGKGGVCILTKSLAKHLAPHNIRVNCVCPGSTDTPMLPLFMGRAANPDEFRKNMMLRIPLRRLGKPEDVAQAALFLVSDEASFITGVLLPVDGGMLA